MTPNDDLPVPGPRPQSWFSPKTGFAAHSGADHSIFPFLARVMVEVFLVFTFNRVPQLVVELVMLAEEG